MNHSPILGRLEGGGKATLFHLGMHKTGTTYIQSLAHRNAQKLKSRDILYPVGPDVGHHGVALGIAGNDAYRAMLADYKALAQADEHILLSSENLNTLSPRHLTQLAREFHPKRRTFAILYFREPAGFARSWIQERIKHGWVSGDDEAHAAEMAATANAQGTGPELNYVSVAEKIRESFGAEQTVFVAFDNVVVSKTDLFQHFLENVVGVQGLTFNPVQGAANEHGGFQLTELQRLIHRLAVARCHSTNISVSLYVRRNFQRIVSDIPELARFAEFKRSVTLRSRAGAFKAMERTLFQRFGDCFLNAAGNGFVFDRLHAAELTWCDLGAFSRAFPLAIKALEDVLDDIIAKVPSLLAQQMRSTP